MYFRLLCTLPVTDFSLLRESNKLTWRWIRRKVALINDDWRLRNDVPYKAVERYTKQPTRIKLQNHLSKLNVTHTKKWFVREWSKSQRYARRLSIINFHYELSRSEKLMGKPSLSKGRSMFKQVWLFSTSWLHRRSFPLPRACSGRL